MWVLIQVRSEKESRTWPIRDIGVAVVAAGAAVAPWLIWNFMRFGTIEQASATARPMVVWTFWNVMVPPDPTRPPICGPRPVPQQHSSPGTGRSLGWSPMIAVAAIIGGVWITVRHRPSADAHQMAQLGGLLLAGGTVLAIFHAAVRMVPREYYFDWVRMSVGLLAAALGSWAVSGLGTGRGTTDGRPTAIRYPECCQASGAGCTQVVLRCDRTDRPCRYSEHRCLHRESAYAWQTNMVEAGRWLNKHTAEGDVVLSFNAGIIGYYSERPVINLDGVINNSALEALKSRNLAEYMCDSGAKWYADFEPVMLDEHRPFLGKDADRLVLEPVYTVSSTPKTTYQDSELTVYRFSCSD